MDTDIQDLQFNGQYFEFEDQDQFMSLAKKVQDMSHEEYLAFEKEVGFQSVYGNYLRAIDEYANVHRR